MAQAKKKAPAKQPGNAELDRLRKENDELKKRLARIEAIAAGDSAEDDEDDDDDLDEEDDSEIDDEED
jgi:hypothetical protein